MAVLEYLCRAGLTVKLDRERLRNTPADRITADLRQFIRGNRDELQAELCAANDALAALEPQQASAAPAPIPTPAPAADNASKTDSEPRRAAWPITRGGKPIGYMVGQPNTYAEALAEARWRWPDADILEN